VELSGHFFRRLLASGVTALLVAAVATGAAGAARRAAPDGPRCPTIGKSTATFSKLVDAGGFFIADGTVTPAGCHRYAA